MYLLDTNVLSELMRPVPDPAVRAWIDGCSADDLWISSVTAAEIRLGVALLPDGRRRSALEQAVQGMLEEDFDGRCLPFDDRAAVSYATIVADRAALGRPITVEDAQIAAIARSTGLTVVTRNLRDFAHTGVESCDPFG